MTLVDHLSASLDGGNLRNLAQQLGVSEGRARSGVDAALPMILGALSKVAGDSGRTGEISAVAERHMPLADAPESFLASPDNGEGPALVEGLFGKQRSVAESGLARAAGLQDGQASTMLENLLPLVMGTLGQEKRAGGLDSGGLAELIGAEKLKIENGPGDNGLMELATSLIDRDKDGSVIDDVAGFVAGFFKK